MQLILLLLLLMSGGSTFREVKPLIGQVIGRDFTDMLDGVEELTQLVAAFSGSEPVPAPEPASPPDCKSEYPLAPIAHVADESITRSLARYISTGT